MHKNQWFDYLKEDDTKWITDAVTNHVESNISDYEWQCLRVDDKSTATEYLFKTMYNTLQEVSKLRRLMTCSVSAVYCLAAFNNDEHASWYLEGLVKDFIFYQEDICDVFSPSSKYNAGDMRSQMAAISAMLQSNSSFQQPTAKEWKKYLAHETCGVMDGFLKTFVLAYEEKQECYGGDVSMFSPPRTSTPVFEETLSGESLRNDLDASGLRNIPFVETMDVENQSLSWVLDPEYSQDYTLNAIEPVRVPDVTESLLTERGHRTPSPTRNDLGMLRLQNKLGIRQSQKLRLNLSLVEEQEEKEEESFDCLSVRTPSPLNLELLLANEGITLPPTIKNMGNEISPTRIQTKYFPPLFTQDTPNAQDAPKVLEDHFTRNYVPLPIPSIYQPSEGPESFYQIGTIMGTRNVPVLVPMEFFQEVFGTSKQS